MRIEERASTGKVKSALFGDKRGLIKTFAIFTAENPMGKKLPDEENRRRNKRLRREIEATRRDRQEKSGLSKEDYFRKLHVQYIPIEGKFGNDERSYIVINLSFEDAESLAKSFGQMSFFFGIHKEDGTIVISYYERESEEDDFSFIESTKRVDDAKDFDDFFSKYNGLKWSFYLDYFNESFDMREIVNMDAFNKSLDDNYTMRGRASYRRWATRDRNVNEGVHKKKKTKHGYITYGTCANPDFEGEMFNHMMGSDGFSPNGNLSSDGGSVSSGGVSEDYEGNAIKIAYEMFGGYKVYGYVKESDLNDIMNNRIKRIWVYDNIEDVGNKYGDGTIRKENILKIF